jgi:CHAT domain-containing protein/tetratricopeptide (TPR) repeat protein
MVSSEAWLLVPREAIRLNDLAFQLHNEGKLSDAARAAEASLALIEKRLGAEHQAVATALRNLAVIYTGQQVWEAAESALMRALDVVEKALGPMHLELATVLDHLGSVYMKRDAYAKAKPYFVRALGIREYVLGATHLDVAESLDELGGVYCGQATYEPAKLLFARSLAIREAALGPTHPDTAQNLVKLSFAHQHLGEYKLAEPLLVRALAVFENTPSATNADIAKCLNNLASVYKAQGAHHRGRPLLARALELYESALGPMHPLVGVSLHNLASNYALDGAPETTALFERAIAIQEAALDPMHPHLAMSLANLASHHRRQQAYERAEPLYLRAAEILEQALDGMHPELPRLLAALADLYWDQGRLDQSESLYVRAIEITERALGAAHPNVAVRLHELAALRSARGDHARALTTFARAAAVTEHQLHRELVGLPARRKRALLSSVQGETECIVSVHVDTMPDSTDALELALATVVRRKHRAVDSLAENQIDRLVSARPELRDTAQQLVKANARLSSWLRKAFLPKDTQSYFDELEALRTRVDELETKLNAAGAELRASAEMVTVPAIRAALPHGAALVELVRYHRFDPSEKEAWHEARYAAYVLSWQGPPRWAALGEAAAIDAAIDTMVVAMRSHRDQPVADALQRLHALVFEPIRGWLTDASHLIVSPDDKLNLVPFEALQDPDGNYVLESWLVSYLGSGRDLLRLRGRRAARSIATIVAAPDYGTPRSTGSGRVFSPLDGARSEATELPEYFARVRTLTGTHATKAALAATVGPSVLHIATHGYFERAGVTVGDSETERGAPAQPTSARATTRATAPRDVIPGDGERSRFVPLSSKWEFLADPLERAGLALAGANNMSDGIVTALELASYDWRGTQLVVLSACDTGLGVVPAGDGVHGMRRALMLAGTETQVVSLWNVSDSSTAELMREFYSELAHGTGRAEALRRAKLRLLGGAGFAHPYYWAAFIPAGDWTPLASDVIRPIARREARAGSAAARRASSRVTWAGYIPASGAPIVVDADRPQNRSPAHEGIASETSQRPELPADLELTIVLLMPPEQILSRVDSSEMTDHVRAVCDELVGVYAREEIWPAPMGVFVAIKPGRRLKVWVKGIDCELAAEDVALIERRSSAWRVPAVTRAVTFACKFTYKDQPLAGSLPTPRAWAEASHHAGKTLSLPDELIDAVWPD